MRSTTQLLTVSAVLALTACAKEATDQPVTPPPPTAVAPTGDTAAAPPPAGDQPAFVTSVTSVKREPNEEKKVTDPQTNKQVSNWIATLHRGEQVTLVKQEGPWAQVKTSAEAVGWVKSDSLMPAEGVTLATVLEDTKTFSRPDFSALNAAKTFVPGTLLFVTKTKDPFSEVNYVGEAKLWVMSDKLTTDTNEVEASRLVSKARWLEERKDPSAAQFWDLAKSSFAQTKLVQLVGGGAAGEPAAAPEGTPTAEASAPN